MILLFVVNALFLSGKDNLTPEPLPEIFVVNALFLSGKDNKTGIKKEVTPL